MSKSPDAFRTISEVAEWLQTPAHVLRFWESRFAQVKPVKRAGGRRYYRPNDMLLLGGIKKLLHEDGMTIKGAQKMLRAEGVKKIAALSKPLDDMGEIATDPVPAPDIPETTPPPPTPASEPEAGPEPLPEPAPVANDPEPQFELEPATTTQTASPEPAPAVDATIILAIETPDDPEDDAETNTPASLAARLRQSGVAVLKDQPEIPAIIERLQMLHNRLTLQIDADTQS